MKGSSTMEEKKCAICETPIQGQAKYFISDEHEMIQSCIPCYEKAENKKMNGYQKINHQYIATEPVEKSVMHERLMKSLRISSIVLTIAVIIYITTQLS